MGRIISGKLLLFDGIQEEFCLYMVLGMAPGIFFMLGEYFPNRGLAQVENAGREVQQDIEYL